MRNTLLSISAFGLVALAAGFTIAVNSLPFFQQVEAAPQAVRSTYSFGARFASGNFNPSRVGLSYFECWRLMNEEESALLRSGPNHVCKPEDGDGSTYSLFIRGVDTETATPTDAFSVLFDGMTERDCEAERAEMGATAVAHNPLFVDVFRCIPESGTSYYTSLTWRLVSEAGHTSGLGTRSDCEANLAILDEARLAGSGSGLTYRCVEAP